MTTESRNRGGRPPLTMTRIRKHFTLTLYEGIDDDLIAWFDSIQKGEIARSITACVPLGKTALRQGGMSVVREDETSEDLMSDDAFADFLDAL